MTWTTLTLRVETPLFGGDDPQGHGDPIRVPSIRGALRFWFRAAAAGHGIRQPAKLWAAEQHVFGSANQPSPIALRIDNHVRLATQRKTAWTQPAGVKYLLGQGLWSGGLSRGYVEPGTTFGLRIKFTDDDQTNHQFMLALWAWLTYGGLGARTHRGFGRLSFVRADRPLPDGWTPADLTPPATTDDWFDLFEEGIPKRHRISGVPGWSAPAEGDPSASEPLPTVPTLASRWWDGAILPNDYDGWQEALNGAGAAWRAFRAAVPINRVRDPHLNTPEWRNALLNDATRLYPAAAIGLPVTYHSQAGYDGVVEPVIDGKPARRASPVWIWPSRVGTKWVIVTHVFYSQLLPDGTQLRATNSGKNRALSAPGRDDTIRAWECWLYSDARDRRVPDDYDRDPPRATHPHRPR